MSKGEGLKIGIKFTEDLVGDISGNESAFTIAGKEYKYVHGALIDKEYQVEMVERYPILKTWQDNFENGVMVDTQLSSDGLILGVKN